MYGQIHCCIRSLILEKFGEDVWKKIVREANVDEVTEFMVFHQYSDEPTMRLVAAVATVSGLEVNTVLEVFGTYFFEYCMAHGYDKMLRTLGDSFIKFIQNLDSLHALLQLSYKNIQAPSFRCEVIEENLVHLHYYSYRTGLHPIVKGLVREVARCLFNCQVEIKVLKISSDMDQVIKGAQGLSFQQYVQFELKITEDKKSSPNPSLLSIEPAAGIEDNTCVALDSGSQLPSGIVAGAFCKIFPYHVLFGFDMKIHQLGIGVAKIVPIIHRDMQHRNVYMSEIFSMIHPKMDFCYANIAHFTNAVFLLQLKALRTGSSRQLIIKGQIIEELNTNQLFFIGSPRIENLTDLLAQNIYLSDIPIYDVTRELVLLNQQRIAEIEVSKQLDETTAELKKTGIALEHEKAKTDRLLHEMLPVKVANTLKAGKTVEAEKFKEVTIFFSDIVNFTNIASASTPMAIVDMLNNLYERFDILTNKHDVYKVETIGDAYMVVGGVPEPTTNHAQKVCDFAMNAVVAASQVASPVTGHPIQIRVGIHTGPVVAGVVGKRMPRYCLFGDTVNVASRMESHGVAKCVHISSFTYDALKSIDRFCFLARGLTAIKGKGLLHTYFIISNGQVELDYSPISVLPKDDIKDEIAEQADSINSLFTDSTERLCSPRHCKSRICSMQ